MKTILVVDDEPQICLLVRRHLEHAGYRVLTCGDGPKALETLAQESVDAVLTDIVMPVMDGFAFLAEKSKNLAFAPIPIILINWPLYNNRPREGQIAAAKAKMAHANVVGVVPKPFAPAELVTEVNRLFTIQ